VIKHGENKPVKRSNVLVSGFFVDLIKALKRIPRESVALTRSILVRAYRVRAWRAVRAALGAGRAGPRRAGALGFRVGAVPGRATGD
jgi:hypothetical protein